MTTRKIVSFRFTGNNDIVGIEMPGDVAVIDLLPDIFNVLNQGNKRKDIQKVSMWTEEDGVQVDLSKSLDDQNISNSEIIGIGFDDDSSQKSKNAQAKLQRKKASTTNGNQSSPDEILSSTTSDFVGHTAEVRKQARAQSADELQIDHPCLIFEGEEKGFMFVLGDSLISIGRPKGNYHPDIDLTEIDLGKVSSRPHVEIEKTDNRYSMRALRAKNGTFLNNEEVSANETRVLSDGDVIQFGFTGIKLTFRSPK